MANKKHTLPVTSVELEVLKLLNDHDKQVALMPVFFNDQQRFAIVLIGTTEAGTHASLLAILTSPEDEITDAVGRHPSITAPGLRRLLN